MIAKLFGAFLLAGVVGLAIRFVLVWAISNVFTLKQNAKQIIPAAVIMIAPSALFAFLKADHWVVYFLMGALAFLSKYLVEKASTVSGAK